MKKNKKILITGASGFLGRYLVDACLEKGYEISAITHRSPLSITNVNTFSLDICNNDALASFFTAQQFDVICHLAAASQPNYCEKHEKESYQINVKASINLAQFAKDKGMKFLFTSTDLVFDGLQPPYAPSDLPKPSNHYAKQKVVVENWLLAHFPSAIVARMPLMYGIGGSNFLKQWVQTLQREGELNAFVDEVRTSVYGADAAAGLVLLLESGVNGIWHLGGFESISRFDFAHLLADTFGLDKNRIVATRLADFKMPANRPPDTSMDSSASFKLGYVPSRTREALSLLCRENKDF